MKFTQPDLFGEIYVARFDAAGRSDASFGTSGLATIRVTLDGNTFAIPSKVVVQPSGRIVVAGEVEVGTIAAGTRGLVPLLVGLTASGAPDPSFGGHSSGGMVVLPTSLLTFGPGNNFTSDDMVLASDGSIVLVTGEYPKTGQTGHLVRLTVDGVLDPSFGTGGIALITGGLMPLGLTMGADGKLIVPGYVYDRNPNAYSSYHFAAGRFDADGRPDPTFGLPGNPGVETYPTTTQYSRLGNAFLDGAGHVVLVGQSWINTGPYLGRPGEIDLFRADTSPTVTPPASQPPADLVGTGTTDLSVYLTASGSFASLPTTGRGGQIVQFGVAGPGQTIPAVADYQGVGHTQIGAYLTASGVYAIQPTATSPGLLLEFGTKGAGQTIPVPADYEGAGKADVAVYLTASGTFAIRPSDGSPGKLIQFGATGLGQSIPVPADYYGTGQADVAVYLAAQGAFAVKDPTGTTLGEIVPFGKPGLGNSIPVPGDYDNSGHVELAVYIPSQGAFYYRPSLHRHYFAEPDVRVPFGTANSGAIPVPGDYDGSGRTEFALYYPATATLTYRPAFGGPDVTQSFGTPGGSVPVAALAGNLPQFGGPAPGSSAISRNAVLGPGLTAPGSGSGMTASVLMSRASALPGGPLLGTKRAALARVNQAVVDPGKLSLR